MKDQPKQALENSRIRLASLKDELIADLEKLVSGDWGLNDPEDEEELAAVDIEIFVDGFRLVAYPMDKFNSQLGYKPLLEGLDEDPLGTGDVFLDGDLYDFDNEDDMKEMREFDEAQNKIFFDWFLECWNKVDTSNLKMPMYIMFHDSFKSFNLNVQKWVG